MNDNKRIISIDYLRFLSMFGIVMIHVMNRGGVLININVGSLDYYIVNFLFTLVICSVNIFAIITGLLYFNKKTVKLDNLINLIIIVLFYSVLITTIFYTFNFFGIRSKGLLQLISSLFPSVVGRYWYITCYILLYFMIPYLNYFLDNLSKEKFKKLLFILFVFLSVFSGFGIDYFKISNGYSPFWLIYCFMIGFYIKKYEPKIKNKNAILYILVLLIIASTGNYILNNFLKVSSVKWLLIDYNSPFIVLASTFIVMIFIENNFKYSKIIDYFQKHSFSVYIIHGHILIFDYILIYIYKLLLNHNIFLVLIGIVVISLFIYIISSLIDSIRLYIFKFLKIDLLTKKIGQIMEKSLRKVENWNT